MATLSHGFLGTVSKSMINAIESASDSDSDDDNTDTNSKKIENPRLKSLKNY